MRCITILILLGLPLLPLASPRQDASDDLDDFGRRLVAQLQAVNPTAAATFEQANEARYSGDHQRASTLYGEVETLVPTFSHATRLRAYEELALGNTAAGIDLMRKAVGLDESALNLAGLARALVWPMANATPSMAAAGESLRLAYRASDLAHEDLHVQITLCRVALNNRDLPALQTAVQRLRAAHPDQVATHYCEFFLHADRGRQKEAEASLARARALGLPEENYQALLASLHDAQPLKTRLVSAAGMVGLAWAGCFAALFLLGWCLSRLTLREANRASRGADAGAVGSSIALRRFYALVLWISCVFYYASIPLVLVSVLVAGGGIIYSFFVVGTIPIKIAGIVLLATGVTLWAVVRSLFARRRDVDPGMRLEPGSYPKLRNLLDEVGARIGTRTVDNVYLTPGTDLAVMERGGSIVRRGDRSERCLILGAAVVDGMRIRPFKAILAHEYGHFSNRDTAGGAFSLSVRGSLLTMAGNLVQAGAAAWYNPAWIFLQTFYRVFLVISQGATRLQEVLADRWAALSYGAGPFEAGLRHVIARAVVFSDHINRTIQEVVERNRPLANLYVYRPDGSLSKADLDQQVEAALNAPPSLYDSHPSPADRFRWVQAVAGDAPREDSAEDVEVWDLLGDRDELEREMTRVVRDNIYEKYGHRIVASAEEIKTSIWD